MIGKTWLWVRQQATHQIPDRMRLLREYLLDAHRYFSYSGTFQPDKNREALRADLTKHYHIIEKGLALPAPRPWAGQVVVGHVIRTVSQYLQKYGADGTTDAAVGALCSYRDYGLEKAGTEGIDGTFLAALEGCLSQFSRNCSSGGVMVVNGEEIRARVRGSFAQLAASRHSVRDFSDEPVDPALIREAVRIAQSTPSVCNRQAWRTHLYSDAAMKAALLNCQNGNRGFGDRISQLLLVTCKLRCFFGEAERLQAYIDGGMFAMSLVYSLHSLGLGTCCLNLSIDHRQEQRLRSVAGVGEDEVFIFMIGTGHLPGEFRVAVSRRHPLSDVLVEH